MSIQSYPPKMVEKRIKAIADNYGIPVSRYVKLLLKIGVLLDDYGIRTYHITDNIEKIAKLLIKEDLK